MLNQLRKDIGCFLQEALIAHFPPDQDVFPLQLEIPSEKKHGDFSSNIALKSAKLLRKAPMMIAQDFLSILEQALAKSPLKGKIERMEVVAPGFINFFLTPGVVLGVLEEVFKEKECFGQCDFGQKEKIQIEFVSANPTGPLSVAHARQAVVGDVLANILNFIGFDAHKEYYVNDGGNQIVILGRSIKLRVQEILGQDIIFPEDCYQGAYIKDMAAIFIEQNKIAGFEDLDDNVLDIDFQIFGRDYLLNVIKADLDDFGVTFDCWSHESLVANAEKILGILKVLQEKGVTYEKDGALWFASTRFGDDKDRVLRKSDGTYTYLTPDIVYHKNKFDRGFSRLFNIWGPDHHGYIPRIKAAAEALGYAPQAVAVLIVQLATIYKQGQAVSMSTRRGEYISLREVMDEVGVDAARFFFLMRHINVHLDFDLELAKKQTPENPVYYIQYAHARICSVFKKAQEAGVIPSEKDFSRLVEAEEIDLVKKMGGFQDALIHCYTQVDPYTLVSYLQELAMDFHRFYDRHRVVDDDASLSSQRLGLIHATRMVLANGLRLLGVSTPESM